MATRALVFDFDGLIIDSEGPDYVAWREIYAEFGCSLPLEVWADYIGRAGDAFDPYLYLESMVGRSLDREAIRARRRARFSELVLAAPLLPGVIDYLDAARSLRLRLGIASSSRRSYVLGHLDRLGIADRWHGHAFGDEHRAKPQPDLFLAVAEALGVLPSEAVAFEDSPNGIRAAKAAGLLCVAVPCPLTAQLDLSQADLHLSSLAAMPLTALLAHVGEASSRQW